MDVHAPRNVMLARCQLPMLSVDAGYCCGRVPVDGVKLAGARQRHFNRRYHPKLVASTGVTETTLYELYRSTLPYIQ